MGEQRATSWTGSEALRREQGVCLPPTPRVRYLVPAGTRGRVSKDGRGRWRPWVTRRPLAFERCLGDRGGWFTFRQGGYLLSVRKERVERPAPEPSPSPSHNPGPD